MLGVLMEDEFKQFILDPRLSSGARNSKLKYRNLQIAIAELLQIANKDNRLSIANSFSALSR